MATKSMAASSAKKNNINKNNPNIFFIFGDDIFRLQSEKKKLIQSLKQNNSEAPFLVNLSPKDDLQSALFGVSLFAQQKIILIDLTQFEAEEILYIFEMGEPIPDFVKIIFHQNGKPDKRLKLFKLLEEVSGKIIEVEAFSPWKTQDLLAWLKEQAEERNIKIERIAIAKLIEYYGGDTAFLISELERLHCYAGNQDSIKLEHVVQACQSRENLFALADYLLHKQLGEFSRETKKLGIFQNPLVLIAGLQTIFRGYISIKSLADENLSLNEIAASTGKNTWRINQDLAKIKAVNSEYLIQINKALNQAEEEIKSGQCFDPLIHFRNKLLNLFF